MERRKESEKRETQNKDSKQRVDALAQSREDEIQFEGNGEEGMCSVRTVQSRWMVSRSETRKESELVESQWYEWYE